MNNLLSYFLCFLNRSFGVVLWELLTGEIPYKDVDSSAIIWGVGSNSLHLPVPSTCPDGFKILMKQTWCAFTTSFRDATIVQRICLNTAHN